MAPQGTIAPADYREFRRLRAWQLKQQGWKHSAIAAALGVTEGAVSQWLKRARTGGAEALRWRKATGPKPRLSAEQRMQIPELLDGGAEAYGFEGNFWTTKRITAVVQQAFGVRYHRGHISKLVRALGLSLQKPQRRATQRDEEAIARWHTERWPAIQKRQRSSSGPSFG